MSWFKRTTKGIRTSTQDKKDTPQGLWYKSPTGKIIDTEELTENFLCLARRWLPRSRWKSDLLRYSF